MFMFGLMELGPNLDFAMHLNYHPVLCCLGKNFHGTTLLCLISGSGVWVGQIKWTKEEIINIS